MPTKMKNYLKRAMETPLKKSTSTPKVNEEAVKKLEDNIRTVLNSNWDTIVENVEQSKEPFMDFMQSLKNITEKPSWFKDNFKSKE